MKERSFRLSREKAKAIITEFGEQTRIAQALNIDLGLLNHYLHGRRHTPETILTGICRETGRQPSDFLENPAEKMIADAAFSS